MSVATHSTLDLVELGEPIIDLVPQPQESLPHCRGRHEPRRADQDVRHRIVGRRQVQRGALDPPLGNLPSLLGDAVGATPRPGAWFDLQISPLREDLDFLVHV